MKNVVLITVDCLRADHIGIYNYKRNTTPYLDDISKKGLLFKNAFANGPNTRHSVPSFLTSTYPLLFDDEAKSGKFQEGRKTIVEVLKEKGYTTLAVHSNPYVSKFYGYDRGFDYFNDYLAGQVEIEKDVNLVQEKFNQIIKGLKALIIAKLPHEDGKTLNKQVSSWMKETKSPFFLWVHYMDVHMPYIPPNEFLKKIGVKTYSNIKKVWMGKKIDDIKMRGKIKDKEIKDYINLYDGCIRYTDEIIKKLIKKIEKNYPETIFIITSDHGEEFREHGDLSHIEKLYDELLHVPLIIYGKGIKKKKVEKPVSLIDLSPTILNLLGINNSNYFQGKPFFDSNDFIIAEALKDKRLTAYRDKKWKFILKEDGCELYDINKDPSEKNNLFDKKGYEKEKKKFKDILEKHIKSTNEERKKRKTSVHKKKVKMTLGRLKQI